MSAWMERIQRFQRQQEQWTRGRRVLLPAGLIALVGAVAMSALVASAAPAQRPRPAADTHRAKPAYLLPIGALVRQGWLPAPTLTGDRGAVGVPAGTPPPPTTPNPAAAEQAPDIAMFQGPGGTITPAGLATLALEHGCSPNAAVIATAIAMAESGGSPSAQGDIALMDSVWDWSAGLWQIRGLRSERNSGGLRDSVANQAIDKNAAAMQQISSGCSDWTPWSTYNNGAYLRFVSIAHQAVNYVVRWFDAHGHHYPPVSAPDPTATIPTGGSAAMDYPRPAGAGTHTPPTTARSTRKRPAHSAPPSTASRSTQAGPAPAAPAPTSSSQRAGIPLPAPLPTSTTTKKNKLPLPLPTVSTSSLPLPLPSLSLPGVP